MKRYGWRSEFLTIFPNAIRVKEVEGPDARVIPWVSIGILVAIGCLFWAIYVRWNRFWERRRTRDLDEPV